MRRPTDTGSGSGLGSVLPRCPGAAPTACAVLTSLPVFPNSVRSVGRCPQERAHNVSAGGVPPAQSFGVRRTIVRALLWPGSELTRSAGSFCVRSLGTEPASRHRLRAQDRSADAVGVKIAGHRLLVRALDRSAHALGVPRGRRRGTVTPSPRGWHWIACVTDPPTSPAAAFNLRPELSTV